METTVPSEDRAMRVFVSSTSREEFEEREILVKRIFPQHRKLHENGS